MFSHDAAGLLASLAAGLVTVVTFAICDGKNVIQRGLVLGVSYGIINVIFRSYRYGFDWATAGMVMALFTFFGVLSSIAVNVWEGKGRGN